jgi:hypothetical protein
MEDKKEDIAVVVASDNEVPEKKPKNGGSGRSICSSITRSTSRW